jgi:DNA-binding LacI/PurR family transcriptional regulator
MELVEALSLDPHSSIPLSHQLKVQLTWLIANGSLKAGDRLPSLQELAELLSINLHTVRQAYLKLEAEGLVEIRRGRGAHVLALDPWRIHQAKEPGRNHRVGVILPSIFNPFYQAILHAVKTIADQDQTLLFICVTQDDPGEAWRYFAQLASQPVDGVIVVSHDIYEISPQTRERISHPGEILPLVTVDWPQCEGTCVQIDLESAGYQATRHLLDHGHQRVGLITFLGRVNNVLPVNAGYQRALQENGIALDGSLIAHVYGFGVESGVEGARQLLSLHQPPTAIFAISELLAYGAMLAIKQAGLRIPQDIALIGFNDSPMAALVDPPLTTVNAPAEDLGREAMRALQLLIAGRQPTQQRLVLPTSLLVRQSCGCA